MRAGTVKDSERPFVIGIGENPEMGCFDLTLQIGNLTEEQAKEWADIIADWLTDDELGGWKQRVQ